MWVRLHAGDQHCCHCEDQSKAGHAGIPATMIIDGPAGKRGMMTSEGKSQRTFPPREGARNARFFKGQFSSATLFSGATATTGARVRTRATSQPQSPVRQFGDELDLLRVKASLKPCIDLVSAQTFSRSLFVMSYAPLRNVGRLRCSCEVWIEADSLLTSTHFSNR